MHKTTVCVFQETKTKPLKPIDTTPTQVSTSLVEVTHDKDAHSDTDTHTLKEVDTTKEPTDIVSTQDITPASTLSDVLDTLPETDKHPPKEEDLSKVEQQQVAHDKVVSPPENSATEITQQEIESPQVGGFVSKLYLHNYYLLINLKEPTTVAVQSPKSQPKVHI